MPTANPVTLDDVQAAIDALGDRDRPETWPGVNVLRDHLGRGSWTTIQRHIVALREVARSREPDPLPEELTTLLQDFAGELWSSARAAATRADEQLRRRVADLEAKRLEDHQAHQTALTEAQQEVDRLTAQVAELEAGAAAAAEEASKTQLVHSQALDQAERSLAEAIHQAEQLRERLDSQTSAAAARESQLVDQVERLGEDLRILSTARDQALTERDDATAAARAAETQVRELEEAVRACRQESESRNVLLDAANKQIRTLELAVDESRSARDTQLTAYTDLQAQFKRLEAHAEDLAKDKTALQSQVTALTKELEDGQREK